MGPNSSHLTSKTSERNGESSYPLPHATQRPMDKQNQLTRQSSRSSRSGSRKKRVFGQTSYLVCFGPTEPPLKLSLAKLLSYWHTAPRQSYLSSAASRPRDTCGSTKTQIENCSTTASMQSMSYGQSSPLHCILPTKGSPALQQEHQSDEFQDRGLDTTLSLSKHQRSSSRQVRS